MFTRVSTVSHHTCFKEDWCKIRGGCQPLTSHFPFGKGLELRAWLVLWLQTISKLWIYQQKSSWYSNEFQHLEVWLVILALEKCFKLIQEILIQIQLISIGCLPMPSSKCVSPICERINHQFIIFIRGHLAKLFYENKLPSLELKK